MQVVHGAVLERWSELSDEDIVVQVLAGQTALFEVLMRRHNERIYRAARSVIKDEGEAEDVMQQAYVNAYAHLRQFDRRARFVTWLTRIAVNEAIARRRRRAMHQSIDNEREESGKVLPLGAGPTPENEAYSRELRALVESAVDRLPEGCREVFMLRQIQGLSTTETAESLSISEDAVKARFSRARSALRKDLADRAGIEAANTFTFRQLRCDRVVSAVLARLG